MVLEMKLLDRVRKLKTQSLDEEEGFCRAIYNYRRVFHLTHKEMMEEPIPTFLSNLKYIKEEFKKPSKVRGK